MSFDFGCDDVNRHNNNMTSLQYVVRASGENLELVRTLI